ncbi:hypothetical protein PP568_09905 [Mycobacteroides abscessus]|uniref:hypothetical protein n=1 Tax=Mycobacteroides abscessus TaxID=36809 RepID=UPI00092A3444|nr:hypothetical protein [Mycobacteroides abscessus]MBN7461990.1 hypothetical protein [Mycobacteroides abscessus subsp. abscessus]MDM2407109.1 hypothetical protein [Mycobacteroides abscessus]MDM2414965.1 hypothetical protein [Mycobacteroides abscessus]SHU64848.1 Uncharacterised protein [Mycobacteroides abscessus subsp. abscessus]SIA78870.1 Uncharacterised protein [Mycobacteroides abscessus subsp. abscessus]
MTGVGVASPPIGASPEGIRAGPAVPGVMPVLAGAVGVAGAVLAVGSCWPLAALDTAVVMAWAAAGMSGSWMLGILGMPGDFASWRCSVCWCACCWTAGVPEVALGDLALVLGDDGVLDGLAFPWGTPMRLARVGFVMCGLAVELDILGTLGDSVLDGVLVARGIGGNW